MSHLICLLVFGKLNRLERMPDQEDLDPRLPSHILEKLAQLELELSEGDITEKGFKKKKEQLLSPFQNLQKVKKSNDGSSSPTTSANRRRQRRLTRNESRYHSEIRQEAVQQALAEWKKEQNEPKYMALKPARRKRESSVSKSIQKLSGWLELYTS
ncbi:hypothetical protein FO519_001810 [Halicephalobus sp. NKZ332]|nr:hypothetical protein FO519_001810 [Halicephalobus sp. NKZ332]